MRGLSLVAASGGHSSSQCAGLSLSRPLLLWSTGSRRAGSVVVAHGPGCSAAGGIFPDQGSNPCPLHWQADSQPLRHQGSPIQLFLFISLTGTKCTLLASMTYDHYVAVCRPLHYLLLLRPQICLGLALSSWLGGLLVSVVKISCIASLSYCGPNVLNQFFCDVSPLLNLSCTHVTLTELVNFISAIVICGTLLVALASYAAITRAVLQMPSAAAGSKTLHLRLPPDCGGHLLLSGSLHVLPPQSCRTHWPQQVAVRHLHGGHAHVLPDLVYCLRNKEVRAALRKTLPQRRVSSARTDISCSWFLTLSWPKRAQLSKANRNPEENICNITYKDFFK